MTAKSSLPILFEDPFWIGLHERIDGDKLKYTISYSKIGVN